ncbi:UNVERIFIED_CONTAM: hypothetical protein K2H54_043183 [Gekko kuhli]
MRLMLKAKRNPPADLHQWVKGAHTLGQQLLVVQSSWHAVPTLPRKLKGCTGKSSNGAHGLLAGETQFGAPSRTRCPIQGPGVLGECLVHLAALVDEATQQCHEHEENVTPPVIACVIFHNICKEKGHDVLIELSDQEALLEPVVEQDIVQANKRYLDEGKQMCDVLSNFMDIHQHG